MSPSPGSAGALLTAPMQYELGNGTDAWLWGSGTYNQVETVDGIDALPDVRDRDLDRADDHGAYAGVDLLTKRRITFSINMLGDDSLSFDWTTRQREMASRFNLLRRWLQPVSTDLVLAFRRPWAASPYYKDFFCMVRPKRRAFTSNSDVPSGWAKVILELHAVDPRIYALTANTPVVINTSIGSPSNSGVVHPNGESYTYPVYTITGPAQNPTIANSDDSNRQIHLLLTMSGGDTLVIDTLARTIKLNGVLHYDYVLSSNQWHKLIPQINNNITFTQANSGAATQLSIAHRDTWF